MFTIPYSFFSAASNYLLSVTFTSFFLFEK